VRNRQGAISVFARFDVERRIVLFFFAWGHPAASPRVAAAAVTRRVQRYTNADMPAILGRGVESSSASSFRRAHDLNEIALAGAHVARPRGTHMPSTDLVLGQMLPGTTGQTSANFCRLLPSVLPAGGLLSTALVEYQNKPL
jgi:hypothetical protein